MSGKRKRGGDSVENPRVAVISNGVAKPMSAIAAARLRAVAPVLNANDFQEPPKSPLIDSSASEAAESEAGDIALIQQNYKLSTWQKNRGTVLSDTNEELTIVLEKHATATFVGCFDVKVLKGAVNISGANLGAASGVSQEGGSSYRVFVPSTHPVTKIRGLDRTSNVQLRSCRDAIPFADISPLFSNTWGGDAESDNGRSFSWVNESGDDPLERPLVPEHAPEDWLRAIDDISATASATLVVGPGASGKTTFAKRLLNRYLTGFGKTAKPVPAVCYMDLDYNNPEYTPHGQISLSILREPNFGPAFTHPIVPSKRSMRNETIAAHVLPISGLINYENYFDSCVEDLFRTYQNMRFDGPPPPLICNTPGELYAMHFDIIEKLIKRTKPNFVIHLDVKSSIDEETVAKLDSLQVLSKKTHSNFRELTGQSPGIIQTRTPRELRAMQMQSYFHLAGRSSSSHLTFNPSPLTTLAPWEFCYKESSTHEQALIGILPLHEFLDASHLLTTLNGALVHIVTTSDPTVASQYNQLPRTPESQVPYFPIDTETGTVPPLRPENTTYVCTALVRGIDAAGQILQVLVPKSHEHLLYDLEPEQTVFVAGCCDTPEWAYVEDAYQRVAQRRRDLGERARFVSDEVLMEDVELPPWVARKNVIDGLGYLNAVRRVRKFLG